MHREMGARKVGGLVVPFDTAHVALRDDEKSAVAYPGNDPTPAVWAQLRGVGSGRLRDLQCWGCRVLVGDCEEIAAGDEVEVELRDDQRVLVKCHARVMGLVDYDVGVEIALWPTTHHQEWTEFASRVSFVAPPELSDEQLSPSTKLPPGRIGARICALASEYARATLRSLKDPSSPPIPARLDPDAGLLVEWNPRWASLESPFEVQVEGAFSSVTFVEDELPHRALPMPAEAHVVHRRQMRRVPVPSGARVILRGFQGDAQVELPMRDVSFGGVSAALEQATGSLGPGMIVPEVVLTWKNGPGLRFEGSVRHRSPGSGRAREVVGLELSPSARDQYERWSRELDSLLYPTTRAFAHDFQSIWDLYEDSGYFDLSECNRQTSAFRHLRSSFETVYGKVSRAPELGCLVVNESSSRVEVTMSGLRAWSGGWIVMHLARDRMRPHLAMSDSQPLKDVHFHVFERAGANPDLKWFVFYVRDDAPPFSAAVYRDLTLSVPGSCGVPFEAWKLRVSMQGDQFRPPGIGIATPEQEGEFLEKMQRLRPRAYLEAFDLVPESYRQEKLCQLWADNGLSRDRSLLVATEGGKVVAGALLDAVDDGLHLYGLLDTVRLFEVEPGGRRHFDYLLLAANEWFYSIGKNHFVCMEELGLADVMRSAGAVSLGKAVAAHLPREGLPQMLERVSELTAPKF